MGAATSSLAHHPSEMTAILQSRPLNLVSVEPDPNGNSKIVILLYTRTAVLLSDLSSCFDQPVTEVPEFLLINGKIWIPIDCNGEIGIAVERFKSLKNSWTNFMERITFFVLYNKTRPCREWEMLNRFYYLAFQIGVGYYWYGFIDYKKLMLTTGNSG
jgi:hypothetical protein